MRPVHVARDDDVVDGEADALAPALDLHGRELDDLQLAGERAAHGASRARPARPS